MAVVCKKYPSDNTPSPSLAKSVLGVVCTITRLSGTGSVGAYVLQSSNDNIAFQDVGVFNTQTAFSVADSFVRIRVETLPTPGTLVQVCARDSGEIGEVLIGPEGPVGPIGLTGPAGTTKFSLVGAGRKAANLTSNYAGFPGVPNFVTTVLAEVETLMPVDCTAIRLTATLESTFASGNLTITLMKNGVPTTLSLTLVAGTRSAFDTDSIALVDTDFIAIRLSSTVAINAAKNVNVQLLCQA